MVVVISAAVCGEVCFVLGCFWWGEVEQLGVDGDGNGDGDGNVGVVRSK